MKKNIVPLEMMSCRSMAQANAGNDLRRNRNVARKFLMGLIVGFLFFVPWLPVLAYDPDWTSDDSSWASDDSNRPPTGQSANTSPAGQPGGGLENPLGRSETIWGFLTNLLHALLPLFIVIAVFFIVWSGFQFLTAQGNPQKLETARNTLIWTLVGVAIIVGVDVIIAVLKDVASTLEI